MVSNLMQAGAGLDPHVWALRQQASGILQQLQQPMHGLEPSEEASFRDSLHQRLNDLYYQIKTYRPPGAAVPGQLPKSWLGQSTQPDLGLATLLGSGRQPGSGFQDLQGWDDPRSGLPAAADAFAAFRPYLNARSGAALPSNTVPVRGFNGPVRPAATAPVPSIAYQGPPLFPQSIAVKDAATGQVTYPNAAKVAALTEQLYRQASVIQQKLQQSSFGMEPSEEASYRDSLRSQLQGVQAAIRQMQGDDAKAAIDALNQNSVQGMESALGQLKGRQIPPEIEAYIKARLAEMYPRVGVSSPEALELSGVEPRYPMQSPNALELYGGLVSHAPGIAYDALLRALPPRHFGLLLTGPERQAILRANPGRDPFLMPPGATPEEKAVMDAGGYFVPVLGEAQLAGLGAHAVGRAAHDPWGGAGVAALAFGPLAAARGAGALMRGTAEGIAPGTEGVAESTDGALSIRMPESKEGLYPEPEGTTHEPRMPYVPGGHRFVDLEPGTDNAGFLDQAQKYHVEAFTVSKDGVHPDFAPLVGSRNEVDITPFGSQLQDSIWLHNHPKLQAFSSHDLAAVILQNGRGSIVRLPDGRDMSIMRPEGGWPNWRDVIEAHDLAFGRARAKMAGKSPTAILKLQVSEMNRAFDRKLGPGILHIEVN